MAVTPFKKADGHESCVFKLYDPLCLLCLLQAAGYEPAPPSPSRRWLAPAKAPQLHQASSTWTGSIASRVNLQAQ